MADGVISRKDPGRPKGGGDSRKAPQESEVEERPAELRVERGRLELIAAQSAGVEGPGQGARRAAADPGGLEPPGIQGIEEAGMGVNPEK